MNILDNLWQLIVGIGVIIGIISGYITIKNHFSKKEARKSNYNSNKEHTEYFHFGALLVVIICYTLIPLIIYLIEVKVYGKSYYIQSKDYLMPHNTALKHIIIYMSFIAPIVSLVFGTILLNLMILDYDKTTNESMEFFSSAVFIGYNSLFWIIITTINLMMSHSNMIENTRIFLLSNEKTIFHIHILINIILALWTGYYCLNKDFLNLKD
jgi:hypothetical protein